MEELKQLVIDGKAEPAAARVARLLDEGGSADVLMEKALIPAMDVVGKLFQDGEYFLPELLVSAKAMQRSVEVIKQRSSTGTITKSGKAVVGTVKGDLHDIGKNLLVMALEGASFEVVDLGADVSTQQFIEAVKKHRPHVMGMSALLSTTMYMMKEVIEAMDSAGLHTDVKIMVGGAPLNDDYAKKIGADFYGPDCIAGRDYARSIVARKNLTRCPSNQRRQTMSSRNMSAMTPKERIHAAAKGLPSDRVPVFYWIEAHTGCRLMAEYQPSGHWNRDLPAKFLWNRLKKGGYMQAAEVWRFLPLLWDIHSYNFANAYGINLGADMILASYATPNYSRWTYKKGHIDIVDIYGVGRKIGGGIYPDMVDPPVKKLEDLKNFHFPDATRDSLYDTFRKYRKQYPHHSIAAEAWGPHDWTSNQMIGLERYMTWLVEYPDEIKSFMDRFIDHEIEIARRSVKAGADVVFIYDDYGYNNRPLISMKMWKEFMYPRLKKQVDAAHEDGALVCLHSCGYQMPFLEYYVEMGIDMLQSLQPAAGNDFKLAVDKYGDGLCFVTGIDIQRGEAMTPEEYKQDILTSYRTGRAKNRHILGTTHEIQYTMPDDNLRILFQTVRDIQAGRYD